jgi:hypothetical protein
MTFPVLTIDSGMIAPALRFRSSGSRVEPYKFTEHGSRRRIMKNSKVTISIVVALFVLLTSAFAQNGTVQATIPFAFTVGKQTLPAGHYWVSINGPTLRVTRPGGHEYAMMITARIGGGVNDDERSRLVFHRYGDRRFLSQAWIDGGGHELFTSAAEVEYARSTKPEEAIILASRLDKK